MGIEQQLTDVLDCLQKAISEGNFLAAYELDKQACSLRKRQAKRSALWSMTPGERMKMLHEILFEMK